jgi:thiol-disulfide isomerase/thioredoxin
MKRFLSIFALLCCLLPGLRAQKPEMIKMPALENIWNSDNDTLYVLNFWATWCQPCVAEMPFFDRVQQETEAQKVKVIFVSLDFKSEYESRLVAFLNRKKIYSRVVMLNEPKYNDWMPKVDSVWTGAMPATLFVQHSRGIRVFHEGTFTYATLKTQVDSLLKKE